MQRGILTEKGRIYMQFTYHQANSDIICSMKNNTLLFAVAGVAIAASAETNVLSQADGPVTNEVATAAPVVVTATPITQEETVSADGTEKVTISRAQLDNLNAQDIQTALRQVPGIAISRYSPIGSYGGAQGGSVYVRGLGTARPGGEVRTYTDGAPRESGMWGHPLMDSMPIDFAESVTVQKNPHSGGYAGTFGAVDVETKRRHKEGHEGEVDLAYGRHNTFLSSGSAGVKEGIVDAYAGTSYKYSEGLRDHNTAILKSAFARLGADLSDTEHVGFVYQRTESSVQDPGEIHKVKPRYNCFDLDTDLYTFRFDTDRDSIKGFSLLYFEDGDINWRKDHMDDANPMSPAGDSNTRWLNWGTRSRYDWNAVADLWLVGGIDVADEGGRTYNRRYSDGLKVFSAHGRMVTTSPYVGARYDYSFNEDWTLTPSVGSRYHFHTIYDDEWAPNAAIKLDYQETVEFFVDGTRGIHYPGVYTRAMANDYAKHTLNAEKMDYVSTGTKLKVDDTFDVLASVFHTDVKDRIDKTANGYLNAGNMRATGIELSSHWRPIKKLAFFGGGTFTNPETSPVSRLPRWTFTLGGSWEICDYLVWSVDGQYIGSMNAYSVRSSADQSDLRHLDEGYLFNTRLAVPLKSFTPFGGELYVSLENFTDQKYEYYPGYPMDGIMWYMGCRFKF